MRTQARLRAPADLNWPPPTRPAGGGRPQAPVTCPCPEGGSRLILTGVRPSGLRPNTGPNGPGTLVSPSGTDRKLLNGPGSDVNWTSRRPVLSARPVSDTGRSADQAREGHFCRGICDRYVRRSQSVVTHMGYCLRLECERVRCTLAQNSTKQTADSGARDCVPLALRT